MLNVYQVVCFQEVHGTRVNVDYLRQLLGSQFAVHYSLHEQSDTGGVITIYDHTIWKSTLSYDVVSGRILISELDDLLVVINVHNHGLSPAQVRGLLRIIEDCAAKGYTMLLLGDFNITAH